jgi:hypothetical protein
MFFNLNNCNEDFPILKQFIGVSKQINGEEYKIIKIFMTF